MILTVLAQAVPLPDSQEALLWVIVTALAGVVAYLFRQLRRTEERNVIERTELLEKALAGLGETNRAMRDIVVAMNSLEETFSLRQEIESLRRELRDAPNKKSS